MKRYTLCVIFNNEMSHVLLLRRKFPPYMGCLNALGGKIEDGEMIKAAVLRELEEEADIQPVHIDRFAHLVTLTYPWITRGNYKQHEVELNVFYATLHGNAHIKTGDTAEGVIGWYSCEGLEMINPEVMAGEGNLQYFIRFARIVEGRIQC
jgi:8-oxo-dGTP diphosphatase